MTIYHINTLLEFHLKNTPFLFQSKYYKKIHGASMGSPISPIVANPFIEEVEIKAINTTPTHQSYGLGVWMTPLSSRRQKTPNSLYNISTSLTHTYNPLQRLPTLMDPYHFWTPYFHLDMTTHCPQLFTGNIPTHLSTYIGTAITTYLLNTEYLTPLNIGPGLFVPTQHKGGLTQVQVSHFGA